MLLHQEYLWSGTPAACFSFPFSWVGYNYASMKRHKSLVFLLWGYKTVEDWTGSDCGDSAAQLHRSCNNMAVNVMSKSGGIAHEGTLQPDGSRRLELCAAAKSRSVACQMHPAAYYRPMKPFIPVQFGLILRRNGRIFTFIFELLIVRSHS